MKQMSLGENGFERKTKRTRKREFLDEMNLVVPWAELVSLIAPHAPAPGAKGGRPPFAVETMLRIHFLQQWFNLSDPAMEEALYDTPMFREFAGLDMGEDHLPDESTILRFRHLLEKHELAPKIMAVINAGLARQGLMLKTGTVVDATIIAAPSSSKNNRGERDPQMHQTKKGKQWHFGMKAHIGVDAQSGLVHTVIGTAANVNDVTQATQLLHGQETDVFADAGYQGVDKRQEAQGLAVDWHIAMRPGKRAALELSNALAAKIEQLEKIKASIRAKVEHPFRLIKQQFGHAKVRYRGLAKNTARLQVMFALGNLWMVRKAILQGTQA